MTEVHEFSNASREEGLLLCSAPVEATNQKTKRNNGTIFA